MKVKINRPDFYEGDKVVTLSASVTSGSVTKERKFQFLIRKSERTASQALAEDIKYIKANIPSIVKDDILIMSETVMPCGSTVVWNTGDSLNVTKGGLVTRPDFGAPSESATITANVTNGEETQSVEIEVTILSMTEEDELDIIAKQITWDSIKGTNVDKARVVSNLVLTKEVSEIPVTWVSSDARFIDTEGKVTRPEYTDSDAQVTLTAILTKGDKSRRVVINGIKVLKKSPSATQRCEQYVSNESELLHWVTANGTNENKDLSSIVESFVLPAENDDMLLTWEVVNSIGESTTNNYLKVAYVDDGDEYDTRVVDPSTARRYSATVIRNESSNATAYLKSTATISETSVGDSDVIPGGTASKIWQLVILSSGEVTFKALNEVDSDEKIAYERMLISTDKGRATWSIREHKGVHGEEELKTKSKSRKKADGAV